MQLLDNTFFSADPDLIRIVEATEAGVGRAYADAVSLQNPQSGTEVRPFAGGSALFAGVDSPMTHALGAGVNGPVKADHLDELERFFAERGSATIIDLCPHADNSLLELVAKRPYRIAEFNHVLVRKITPGDTFLVSSGLEVTPVSAAESGIWARAMLEGFMETKVFPEDAVQMVEAFFHLKNATAVWARRDGLEAGTAAMVVLGEVASFFGDSTLPTFRNQGCHSALIQKRLAIAETAGCRLAMASVLPGSASHRNYERAGFRVLYTRTIVRRDLGLGG